MSSPVGSLINGVLEQIGDSEYYSFYDLLAQHSTQTMKLFYNFSGRPYFQHDFEKVEYAQDDFDYSLGVKGLHTVQRKVEFKPRRTMLPPDLFQKYSEMTFWADTSGSSASVIAPKTNK